MVVNYCDRQFSKLYNTLSLDGGRWMVDSIMIGPSDASMSMSTTSVRENVSTTQKNVGLKSFFWILKRRKNVKNVDLRIVSQATITENQFR